MELKVLFDDKKNPYPLFQQHSTDAGFDLTAIDYTQKSKFVYLLGTGIAVQPPKNHFCLLVPRSSIIKTNFVLANSIGIIDEDYQGEILIALRYIGEETNEQKIIEEVQSLLKTRVAQLILVKKNQAELLMVKSFDTKTKRGSGGFGSTGK